MQNHQNPSTQGIYGVILLFLLIAAGNLYFETQSQKEQIQNLEAGINNYNIELEKVKEISIDYERRHASFAYYLGVIFAYIEFNHFDEADAIIPLAKAELSEMRWLLGKTKEVLTYDQQLRTDLQLSLDIQEEVVKGLEDFVTGGKKILLVNNPTKVDYEEAKDIFLGVKIRFQNAKDKLELIANKEKLGVDATEESLNQLIRYLDEIITIIDKEIEN